MGLFSKKEEDKDSVQEDHSTEPIVEGQGVVEDTQVSNPTEAPELPENPPEGIEYEKCVVDGCENEMTSVCPTCGKKLCNDHKPIDKHECNVKIEAQPPKAPEMNEENTEMRIASDTPNTNGEKPAEKVIQIEGL